MSNSYRYADPAYVSWLCMRKRCSYAGLANFKYYGGRGIRICERWDDFLRFKEDMGPRPEGFSLERIDNSKDYTPENCRWASRVDQCSNRRSNIFVEWHGEVHTLKQWSYILDLPYKTLWYRKNAGWSIERMFLEGLNHEKSIRT